MDPNQAEIVAALRKVGARVAFWGTDGAPDLCVGFASRVYLLEVKSPLGRRGGSSGPGQRLNDLQLRFHRVWAGYVDVVRTPTEALLAIRAIAPKRSEPNCRCAALGRHGCAICAPGYV